MSEQSLSQTLEAAKAWVETRFAELSAESEYDGHHPSHAACAAMLEAEAKFFLDTFGVEGWCDDGGRNGISYLNAGDAYCQTLCFAYDSGREEFLVAAWGDIAEERE